MIELLRNPAMLSGLARALLIFATVMGVKISQAQQDAALNLLLVALPIIALIFTGVTVASTQPKPVPADKAVLSAPESPPAP